MWSQIRRKLLGWNFMLLFSETTLKNRRLILSLSILSLILFDWAHWWSKACFRVAHFKIRRNACSFVIIYSCRLQWRFIVSVKDLSYNIIMYYNYNYNHYTFIYNSRSTYSSSLSCSTFNFDESCHLRILSFFSDDIFIDADILFEVVCR